MEPPKPKKLKLYFEPANEEEHKKGNAGQDVPDYCRNCYRPFMEHTNGRCPPDADCGPGVAVS